MLILLLLLVTLPILVVSWVLWLLYLAVNAPIWIGLTDGSLSYMLSAVMIFLVGGLSMIASTKLFIELKLQKDNTNKF